MIFQAVFSLLFFCVNSYAGTLEEALAPSSQIILVTAEAEDSFKAEVSTLEKGPQGWKRRGGRFPAVLGKDGLATGAGVYSGPEFAMSRAKVEGDGRSPTGVFEVGQVYGVASEFKTLLPYTTITSELVGVDDPKSRYYNRIIDRTKLTEAPDWKSQESMKRKDRLYQWLLEIRHNPKNTPGLGSLIFLHVWRRISSGTVGCVAVEEGKIRSLLSWVNPAHKPLVVIIPKMNLPALKTALGISGAW